MHKRRKGLAALLAAALVLTLFLPTLATAEDRQFSTNSQQNQKAENQQQKFFDDQVILKLKGTARQQNEFLTKNNLTVLRRDNRFNFVWAKASKGTNIERLITTLKKNPMVDYAQPNYIYKTFGKPNDPLYPRQWALQKINAEKAWDVAGGKQGVIVAILDTGVDVNHPDLQGKLVPGTNTVNPLKSNRDDDGHGTHVAGIAAATINNGAGIAGVAGNAKIMPVKVFDYWGGSDISVADGIIWAVDHGAKVINMSFGTWSGSTLLGEAIEYAHEKGVIMVAAAGNWASQNISYPAALSQVIAVSATDANDKLSRFSSYGPEIDVSAPGEKIFSTYWDQHKGATYCEMDGTSMAAPQVAGLAALLLSVKPSLSGEEVRQVIESSAVDLGDQGWDPQYGHGRIDVYKALTTSFDKIDIANNTQDGAVQVASGQEVTQKIDYGFDEDWFTIAVPDKGSLQVELQPAGKVSPALEIYNEEGERLEAFNVVEPENSTDFLDYFGMFSQGQSIKVGEPVYGIVGDLAEGNYFVRVFGNHNRWSDANYTLIATALDQSDLQTDKWEANNVQEEAKPIKLATKVSGLINPSGDEDWYKVNLSPNRIYKIDVQVPAELDLAVEIFPEPVEEENVNSDEDWMGYWDYGFSMETIDYNGQGVDESGTFKVYSEKPQPYYFKVYEPAQGAANSEYVLSITEYTPPRDSFEPNDNERDAKGIAVGDAVEAVFSSEEDQDWYTFTVYRTGVLEINWDTLGVLTPEMALLDEELNLVGYHDFWGFDETPENTADLTQQYKVSPGKYYLAVANSWGAVTGTYKFTLELKNFDFIDQEINDSYDQAVSIGLGQSLKGTLYPDGDVDYYVVDVDEKGPVLVQLTPPKGIDSGIVVYKEPEPSGYEEEDENGAYSDDWNEPDLEFIAEINSGFFGQPDTGVFMASKPGRYYLIVAGLPEFEGDDITMLYTLSVTEFDSKPDWWENNNTMTNARAIGNNAVFSPTFMGTEDKDWYKIYIPASSSLSVKLEVPNDIDGVVEFYDPSGHLLKKADQALVGEAEGFTLAVNKAGIYYIKAYDYLGNASVLPYKLTVRYTKKS